MKSRVRGVFKTIEKTIVDPEEVEWACKTTELPEKERGLFFSYREERRGRGHGVVWGLSRGCAG